MATDSQCPACGERVRFRRPAGLTSLDCPACGTTLDITAAGDLIDPRPPQPERASRLPWVLGATLLAAAAGVLLVRWPAAIPVVDAEARQPLVERVADRPDDRPPAVAVDSGLPDDREEPVAIATAENAAAVPIPSDARIADAGVQESIPESTHATADVDRLVDDDLLADFDQTVDGLLADLAEFEVLPVTDDPGPADPVDIPAWKRPPLSVPIEGLRQSRVNETLDHRLVRVDIEGVPLRDVLSDIADITGHPLRTVADIPSTDITLSETDVTLRELLEKTLQGTGLAVALDEEGILTIRTAKTGGRE